MRIGQGYDVHRLVEGRRLIIGGVDIPYEKGLLGHSDADVLLHAVMDALLGAAALGGPMVWPPLERVREVTNRPWKFGPPSGGHGDSAPAGGLSSQDAPPIFFSLLRKRKRPFMVKRKDAEG